MSKPVAETALKPIPTLEEEAAMTERARLKKERIARRREARMDELKTFIASIKFDAAKITNLRRHMFKDDEELTKLGLTKQQKAIVRQFEEPKKATAFGVESAAKLVESEVRAAADKQKFQINVQNATIALPEKQDETVPPVYIDVQADDK
jgi:hypothetical protein